MVVVEKVTRGAAIITVKRWMPDTQPMSDMIRTFAQRLLHRLQYKSSTESTATGGENGSDGETTAMEDGEMPPEEMIETEFLPGNLQLPAEKSQVLQHVELIFALCVKSPEFLDECVMIYAPFSCTFN